MCVLYMVGRTRYSMAKEVLIDYKDEILNLSALKTIIMMKLGSDDRTIKGYLKIMIDGNLIKEVENMKFMIL